MADYQAVKLSCVQPSQFYISEEKLRAIEAWFDPNDLSIFEPIPIKLLDGELVSTDGHTRCVAAMLHGLDVVPFVWEEEDLDWEMYRRCVVACKERKIFSACDLKNRIISAADYKIQWDQWCDEMQAEVEAERTSPALHDKSLQKSDLQCRGRAATDQFS